MVNKRPHYVSPARIESARDALERAMLAQQNSEETANEPETPPEGEQEFATNTEFSQRIAEERATRAAINAQEKLNTRINIDDTVNFERKALPPAPPKADARKPAGKKDDVVVQRTQQWTNYLLDDANPLLVKVTSGFVGIPNEAWLDDVVMEAIDPKTNKHMVFWSPPLRSRLELDRKKAEKLARAAAEFSVSPMGVGIFTWIETHQFMICVGSALIVGAQYGWTLMQTKAEVSQLRTIYEQQMAQQMQQMQKPPTNFQEKVVDTEQRLPGFNESVSSFDGQNS